MKQPKNSLQLPKPTADNRKIQNKLTTVGSGEKNFKKNVAKVKGATSDHSIYS